MLGISSFGKNEKKRKQERKKNFKTKIKTKIKSANTQKKIIGEKLNKNE